MNIEGRTVKVSKSTAELYNYLSDFKNFESIMPEEVTKFEADDTSFVFGIKGMPEVRLIKKSSIENSQIILAGASSKLPVELKADFVQDGDNCTCKLSFDGDFNPMIKMMIQKPLTKFIESLTDKIEKL